MKKAFLLGLTVFGLLCLNGCNKQENSEKETASKTQYVSEDYMQGPRAMKATDKGFYHYNVNTMKGFRYYDVATGNAMYLCNKPECRHDGSEFCVATNDRYEILSFQLYSGLLFAYAMEETDTQYLFKLLTVELDGSGMNEVATVKALEKTGVDMQINNCGMVIHRNTALFEVNVASTEAEKARYYGVAFMDINTGEVSWLDEEPFGADNEEITGISGYGDWIYFCRKEGKKIWLHRYHITEKKDETCKLLVGFDYNYVVKDEDTVLYLLKSGTELYSYQFSTGENKEVFRFERAVELHYQIDGEEGITESLRLTKIAKLYTDWEYIYAREPINWSATEDENKNYYSKRDDACIYVLNRNLEVVTIVDLMDILPLAGFEETEWEYAYINSLYYCGEDIYLIMYLKENFDAEYVFRCKRSDLLAGNPNFVFVYEWKR